MRPHLLDIYTLAGLEQLFLIIFYAMKHNGKYLVRIEDTDKKRSTKEAVQAIHDGLNWLKINSKEEIVYQSSRLNYILK